MSAFVECRTQAEADEAAARGGLIVWRAGVLLLHGSSRAKLHGSSRADLYDSSCAYLYDSSCATLHESSRADLYGSSCAILYGSSSAVLYGSSSATLHESSRAFLHGSSSRAVLHGSSRATDSFTDAPLRRDRPRLILGPLGSRGDTLGVSLPSDGSEPFVYAGCWRGRLSEFVARVDEVYPTGRHGDEYRAAIAMIRAVAAIPQEAA